jgi:L-methionine (R)-S-oxide reductase
MKMSRILAEKRAKYVKLKEDLAVFFKNYPSIDTCARMSTINAFLKDAFRHWGFIGFYTVLVPDEMLQIGPYQSFSRTGVVLATALIPFGKGVCGTAALEKTTQIVADVKTCLNYIPCDDVTRSEIVVPVFGFNYHNEKDVDISNTTQTEKKLIAVLDIDSDELADFDEVDKGELENLMKTYF